MEVLYLKTEYEIKEISKDEALDMIKKFHYSNTLPKINKHFVGFFLESKLVGVITLGWGTRPLHTIKKIFPSLDTKDYYEIGRMCMNEEMPRNSESQMIAQLVKWLKQVEPNLKVLFTWADGIIGKAGYVYQSCSFLYGGYATSDMYLKDGVKIHVRQTRALFKIDENDTRKTIRPTWEQMRENNILHIRGRQFKYIKFLCGKTIKKKLLNECQIELTNTYPKDKDLYWEIQQEKGKWVEYHKPDYKTDYNKYSKDSIKELEEINVTEY